MHLERLGTQNEIALNGIHITDKGRHPFFLSDFEAIGRDLDRLRFVVIKLLTGNRP
jgi:hypothetical protein